MEVLGVERHPIIFQYAVPPKLGLRGSGCALCLLERAVPLFYGPFLCGAKIGHFLAGVRKLNAKAGGDIARS